jgi:eukaryotic-like serine/threonine-protein kinase
MNNTRREQVEELFEAALEREPATRAAYLEGACAGDPELLAEVQAMLAANELGELLFDEPPGDAPAAPAEWIGPYRVLRELGRGGMGVVYLAERADGQYRRRVAIKRISSASADDPIHQRFLAERQILAGLDHPNIARLLDGGVSDDGRPYLVLEYVDGMPITAYCDRHRLGVEERLRLFLEVCAAVQHAHRNLIIHRDLKPGNILVTPAGQVRLLDFGIAKLLNPTLSVASAPVTRLDLRVMTPEYASPEQVRGDSLTTASDVYSLGVLLYELLTGFSPYRLSTRSPAEIVRAVCDLDPERPSARVAETGSAPPAGEAAADPTPARRSVDRHASVARLARQLEGDLDGIVLMALRKEPGRRYASADLLRQDIARFLERLPVLAHRGSRRYRLGKLVRRHRVEAVAAALVVAALVLGLGAALWQAGMARAAAVRADGARTQSEQALRQSEEVAAFLIGLFEAVDPVRTGGDAITAGELMERGVARANALADQPLVQARMFDVVGRVYQSMGQYERAQPLLERALRLRVEQWGPERLEVATSLAHLAEILRRRAEYDSAQTLLLRAGSIQTRLLGSDHPAYGETLHELSRVAVHRGELGEAERLGREALDLRRRVLGPADPLTITSLTQLGTILRQQGDYTGAEAAFREALALRQSLPGVAVAGVAEALELADLLRADRAQPALAEEIYSGAVAALRAAPAPDPTQLVRALGGLALVLQARGDEAGAERQLREALELRRRTYGPEHPLVSAGMIHLAGLYERTGRYDEAESLFREVAAMDVRLLGESHPTHAGTLTAIGRVLIAAGRLEAADSVLARALGIRIAALGTDHPLLAKTLRHRAEVQHRRGEHAAAEASIQQALAIYLAQRQPEETSVRELHALLAEVHAASGRPQEAARHRRLAERS